MHIRIAFGDYELDEARFELRHRGRPVAVQPKVLDLIIYLAHRRERVVGKDELLDAVWKGVAVTEASLSQALSLARRALGDTPEAQHSIRTIRGKGFQFVAPERLSPARPKEVSPVLRAGATALETAEEGAPRPGARSLAPRLFAALHCETPLDGGASWSLADIDEVQVVRGSERRSERTAELTRVLTIAIPGRLVSRRHARFVRTPGEWLVVDESRNGTLVNGERIESRALRAGDLVACGKTLFYFTSDAGSEDADVRGGVESLLGSVTPRLCALERDLRRIAASDVPLTIVGESGVGKTHTARALHGISGRRGALIRLEAATLGREEPSLGLAFERAAGGTVLVETLERIEPSMASRLVAAIESAPGARVMCTSMASFDELGAHIPADLLSRVAGFRCELPPLRGRLGDVGVLAAMVLGGAGARVEIDLAAAQALFSHAWPGNLRELFHVLTGAATLAAGGTIAREHLSLELGASG